MVHFKAEMLCEQNGKHDDAAGVTLAERVRLPDRADDSNHAEHNITVVLSGSFQLCDLFHGVCQLLLISVGNA